MFSDPAKNIDQFDIQNGMIVADLGSGSGFYTIESAKRAGGNGRVYSVDVQKDLLQKIKTNAQNERLTNVETVWGDIEKLGGTRLRDSLADRVILSNSLFMMEDKDGAIKEAKRITKSGGKILIIDWTDSFGNMGPHESQVFTASSAKDLAQRQGLSFEKEISAGDHHYGLIFKKP